MNGLKIMWFLALFLLLFVNIVIGEFWIGFHSSLSYLLGSFIVLTYFKEKEYLIEIKSKKELVK